MNKAITRIITIAALAIPLAVATPAFAAGVTVGNPATTRANVDTFSNFTIVDTNNPVSATGALGAFTYYAANTDPFEFVLVDASDTVQWISPTIIPPAIGVNTWNAPSDVDAQAGWNLGVHFDSTGTIPFDFGGATASYAADESGAPALDAALAIVGTSSRIYSFGAASPAATTTPALASSTITTMIQDSTGSATTSAAIGTAVDDVATVAAVSPATTTPVGVVDFSLYSGTSCTGDATLQSGVSLVNGVAVSSTTTVPAAGLSFIASYDGQSGAFLPSSGICEPLSVPTVISTSTGTTTPPVTGTSTPGTGSISGTVYQDLNRNGVKDASEPVLSGWTINLYNGAGWSGPTNKAPIMSAVSDANGDYSFTGLADGTYSIEEINQPHGLNQFTSDYNSVVIVNGSVITGENFGNVTGNPYSNGKGSGKQGKGNDGDHDGDDHGGTGTSTNHGWGNKDGNQNSYGNSKGYGNGHR